LPGLFFLVIGASMLGTGLLPHQPAGLFPVALLRTRGALLVRLLASWPLRNGSGTCARPVSAWARGAPLYQALPRALDTARAQLLPRRRQDRRRGLVGDWLAVAVAVLLSARPCFRLQGMARR